MEGENMAKLTAAGRARIKPANFAGPDKSYPIEDRSHARAALSMVSRHGSPAVQSEVRRNVAKKYPGIEQSKNGDKKPKNGNGGDRRANGNGNGRNGSGDRRANGNGNGRNGNTTQRLAAKLGRRLDEKDGEPGRR
jgi:hypothetical protein